MCSFYFPLHGVSNLVVAREQEWCCLAEQSKALTLWLEHTLDSCCSSSYWTVWMWLCLHCCRWDISTHSRDIRMHSRDIDGFWLSYWTTFNGWCCMVIIWACYDKFVFLVSACDSIMSIRKKSIVVCTQHVILIQNMVSWQNMIHFQSLLQKLDKHVYWWTTLFSVGNKVLYATFFEMVRCHLSK
jgi:hypothetical protein